MQSFKTKSFKTFEARSSHCFLRIPPIMLHLRVKTRVLLELSLPLSCLSFTSLLAHLLFLEHTKYAPGLGLWTRCSLCLECSSSGSHMVNYLSNFRLLFKCHILESALTILFTIIITYPGTLITLTLPFPSTVSHKLTYFAFCLPYWKQKLHKGRGLCGFLSTDMSLSQVPRTVNVIEGDHG